MHYYQFNIADYRKRTAHLTLVEHAIYRSLIDTYYLEESPLCLDHAKLMRTHSIRTADEVQAFENVLSDFFIQQENGYHHEKCDEELDKIYTKSNKARKSALTRWEKNANAMRTHSEGNATQYPIPNNPIPKKDTSPAAPAFNFKKSLLDLGVSEQVASTWLAVRKKKRAVNSELALKGILAEVQKAGISVAQAIELSATNSWSGFKNEWYRNSSWDGGNGGLASTKQTSIIDDLTNTDWATGGEETPIEDDARSGHTLENIK